MYPPRILLRHSILVVCLLALVVAKRRRAVPVPVSSTPAPYQQDQDDTMQMLVAGPPPEYPTYNEVPRGLQFTCREKIPGYYADPETQCQVWHWCLPSGQKFSFLCPNGTVFNQAVRVCDWWFKVDCAGSVDLYSINNDLYRDREGNLI